MMQFFCILLLFGIIVGFSYLAHKDEQKKQMVYMTDEMLKKPLTDQSVKHYIEFLETAPDRNNATYWHSLCRAYEQIMKAKTIDPRLKKELKKTLRNRVIV
jgi:hypothetical protein